MRDGKEVNSNELFGGEGFAEQDDVAVAVVAEQGELGRVSAPVKVSDEIRGKVRNFQGSHRRA